MGCFSVIASCICEMDLNQEPGKHKSKVMFKLRYNCDDHIFIPFVFPQLTIHLILCLTPFMG